MAEFNREREEAIRRQVTGRIQRRMLLVLDLLLLFFYGIIISGRDTANVFGVFGAVWIMAFVVHSVLVFYWEWAERAVRRALEQERNAYYRVIAETVLAEIRHEKPKRDQRLTLNDDGELYDPQSEALDEQSIYRKRR